MVKFNFHGGKIQFFPPVTRANFRAGNACTGNERSYLIGWHSRQNLFGGNFRACTGNTLISLVGIRGKICLVGSGTWKIASTLYLIVMFSIFFLSMNWSVRYAVRRVIHTARRKVKVY